MKQLGPVRPVLVIALVIALVLTLIQAAACAAPGYYLQAVSGHLALMRGREPIAEVLSSEDVEPQLAEALGRVGEIRQFAIDRLELPDNGSYTRFARTGRDAVTWNVVATPELSLEPRQWCFVVAGCVPYRGYFEHEDAVRFADRLASEGLDVAVTPATAYSTLGWFEDPLLDTMLRYDEEQLAAVLFHELAHQRLYLRGDTAFSESYASFVEEIGVTLWLQSTGRSAKLAEWRQQRQAAADFDALLLQARVSLSGVYAGNAADSDKRQSKAAIFAGLAADYRTLVEERWNGRDYYAGWFSGGLNNARLALFASYRGGVCAFAALYRETGEDMERFHARAAEQAERPADVRGAWLQQPCRVVASRVDL
jgi:predicted aminopeptidase